MVSEQGLDYDEILNQHIGLVKKIAGRFSVSAFDRDDLIQAGLLGVLKAIKHYDAQKGYAFTTYATPYIIGEIKKELAKNDLLSMSTYFKKIVKKVNTSNQNESIEELAYSVNTSRENVILALSYQQKTVLLEQEDLDIIQLPHNWTYTLSPVLSDLSEIDREIFQLKYFMHWTQKDIAKKLSLNQSSISRRLQKIVTMLYHGK